MATGKVKGRLVHRAKWFVYRMFWQSKLVRPMIRHIESQKLRGMVGAEIGVAEGYNARSILQTLDMKRLYLIDPYAEYEASYSGCGKELYDPVPMEAAVRMLRNFKDKITFIRKLAEDAVSDVPDNLDFVYIDGNHDYEFVRKDIRLWYPKVRGGGVIGGHNFNVCFQGVCRAVTEFAAENNLVVKGMYDDWYIQKAKTTARCEYCNEDAVGEADIGFRSIRAQIPLCKKHLIEWEEKTQEFREIHEALTGDS